MPEDLRITEILQAKIEDGVAGVLGPDGAAVAAESQVLRLLVGGGACVDGDQTTGRLLAGVGAEAAGVVAVFNRGSAKDHHAVPFGDGDGDFLPVDEIGRGCVTPAHVAPLVAEWVVLEVELVLAVEQDGAVGVVDPAVGRIEVDARLPCGGFGWRGLGLGRGIYGEERNDCGHMPSDEGWKREGFLRGDHSGVCPCCVRRVHLHGKTRGVRWLRRIRLDGTLP